MSKKDERRRSDERPAAQPFFARFLEGQDGLRVRTGLKGGVRPTKPVLDLDQTMKFPSDSDEGEI